MTGSLRGGALSANVAAQGSLRTSVGPAMLSQALEGWASVPLEGKGCSYQTCLVKLVINAAEVSMLQCVKIRLQQLVFYDFST